MDFRVEFTHFRCLKKTSLRLTPLTVVVGPNASGKSAVLQALDPSIQLTDRDVWQLRSDLDIRIRRTGWNNTEIESLKSAGRGAKFRVAPDTRVYNYQRLHLDLNQMRQPNQVTEQKRLLEHGGNLTNVFATLPRSVKTQLAEQLSGLVPVFSDIDNRPGSPGSHRLVFQDRWKPGSWYEPNEVSDGSMLVLALLLLQHQSPPVEVLAIEELERGLHPYLLGEIVDLLRRLAHGEIGTGPMHILLATHSPGLLDLVKPEEVRFLSRSTEDGSVEIKEAPTDSPGWEEAFHEYKQCLSTAWLSGGLGGVPGS